jgi:hypothetical protein
MAASESTLGDLHEAVANALSEQVKGYTELGDEGQERVIRPSPALLGAAIAFLKNNNITADAEDNEALKNLTAKLKERRNKRTSQASLDAAADDFANRFGGGHLQ